MAELIFDKILVVDWIIFVCRKFYILNALNCYESLFGRGSLKMQSINCFNVHHHGLRTSLFSTIIVSCIAGYVFVAFWLCF